MAVNGERVTPRNVDDILAACVRKKRWKVKLTLVPASSLRTDNPLAPVFKSNGGDPDQQLKRSVAGSSSGAATPQDLSCTLVAGSSPAAASTPKVGVKYVCFAL